jgi:hypothetical protein
MKIGPSFPVFIRKVESARFAKQSTILRFAKGFRIRNEFLIPSAFHALVKHGSAGGFFIFLVVDR